MTSVVYVFFNPMVSNHRPLGRNLAEYANAPQLVEYGYPIG